MIRDEVKIAMVDDHVLFRDTLKHYLMQQVNIRIILDASNADDLLCKLQNNVVDIILMDLYLPTLSGYEALKIIRTKFPHIKVIVLSMNTDLVLINSLLDIGIQGYVSKSDDPDILLQAIKAVTENKLHITKIITEALYHNRNMYRRSFNTHKRVMFDEREIKVLRLLWEEKSNKVIASEIFLSVRSIEKLRQDMKEKVGVKSTIGLIKFALCNNVIDFERTHDQTITTLRS